ncbi:hypothetical protein I79_023407 [Cricetulus griseus]|uniref:Uncharacterized protein n=1 Tax=Cricetulus griseus TaxID=10029 RepID=G3IHV1_CRIGR|nr:hypothetical protein I79_023407 [Cricetulus griseus]
MTKCHFNSKGKFEFLFSVAHASPNKASHLEPAQRWTFKRPHLRNPWQTLLGSYTLFTSKQKCQNHHEV